MVSKPLGIVDRQIEPAWLRFGRWCSYTAFVVIVIMFFLPSPSYAQARTTDGATSVLIVFLVGLLLVAIYFLPAIIASRRHHRNQNAILVLNLFLGWTFVGWVIALVWSASADTEQKSSVPSGGPLGEQIEKDRREGVFRPDGMVGHTPYRELPNGEIEALIQGGNVRFKNLDHLRSMTNAASASQTGNFQDEVQTTPASAATTYRGYSYFTRDNGIELSWWDKTFPE